MTTRRHLSSLFCCSCLPRRQRDNLSSRAFYPDQDSGVEDFSDDEGQDHQYHNQNYHRQGYSYFNPHHQSRRYSSSRQSELEFGTLSTASQPYRDDPEDEDEEEEENDAETATELPLQFSNGYRPRHTRRTSPVKSLDQSRRQLRHGRGDLQDAGGEAADDEYEGPAEDQESDDDGGVDSTLEQDRLLGHRPSGNTSRSLRKNALNEPTEVFARSHYPPVVDDYDHNNPNPMSARPYRIFSIGSMNKGSKDGREQQEQRRPRNPQQGRSAWRLGDGEADAEEVLDVEALITEQERITRELEAQEEVLRRQEEETIQAKRIAAIKAAERRGLLRFDGDQPVIRAATSSEILSTGAAATLNESDAGKEYRSARRFAEMERDSHLLEREGDTVVTTSAASSFVGDKDAFDGQLKMIDLALKKKQQTNDTSMMANSGGLSSLGRHNIPSSLSTITNVSTQAASLPPHTTTTTVALGGEDASGGASSTVPASPLNSQPPKRSLSSVSTSTTTSLSNSASLNAREMFSGITSLLKRVDDVIAGDDGSLSDEASFSDQETALNKEKKRTSTRPLFSSYNNAAEERRSPSISRNHPHAIIRTAPRDPELHFTDDKQERDRSISNHDDRKQELDDVPELRPPSAQMRTRGMTLDMPARSASTVTSIHGNRDRSSSDRLYDGLSSLLHTGASSLMGFFGSGAHHHHSSADDASHSEEDEEESKRLGQVPIRHTVHLRQPHEQEQQQYHSAAAAGGDGGGGVGPSLYASFMSRAKGLTPVTARSEMEEDEEDEYGEELDYNF